MRSKFQHGGILKNGVSLQENKVCGFSTRNFAKYMLKTSASTQRMQTANNFLHIVQHDYFFINRMTYMTFWRFSRCSHAMAEHSLGAAAVQLTKVKCATIDTMSMFYSKMQNIFSVPRAYWSVCFNLMIRGWFSAFICFAPASELSKSLNMCLYACDKLFAVPSFTFVFLLSDGWCGCSTKAPQQERDHENPEIAGSVCGGLGDFSPGKAPGRDSPMTPYGPL